MKKLTIALLLIISLNSFSQNKPMTKQDSLDMIAANRFVDSLEKATSIRDFKLFLDANVQSTKQNFQIFDDFYAFYIRTKYNEWLSKKQKPKQ